MTMHRIRQIRFKIAVGRAQKRHDQRVIHERGDQGIVITHMEFIRLGKQAKHFD